MRGPLILLVIAACRGSTPAPSPAPRPAPRPTPRPAVAESTDLEVVIANHRQFQPTCRGVPPRGYAILLDGRRVAWVDVRCATGFQAPAPTTRAPAFAVPAGRHRVSVVDLVGGLQAFRDFQFPMLDGDFIANRLLIDAFDDRLEIDHPKVLIMRM